MTRYLTCCLYAPIGAMGGMVSGGLRTGWDRPGRSAILGMVAAALGIERTEEAALQALEKAVGMAMLVERVGDRFGDFQTARAASGPRTWTTRAGEIAAIKLSDNPVVSVREYRLHVVVLVTLWLRGESAYSLETLRDALRQPRFVLFMGRKSCPLGLPLDPIIVDAAGPVEALLGRREHAVERELLERLRRLTRQPASPYIALDQSDAPDNAIRVEARTDRLASRRHWQFLPRGEAVIPLA